MRSSILRQKSKKISTLWQKSTIRQRLSTEKISKRRSNTSSRQTYDFPSVSLLSIKSNKFFLSIFVFIFISMLLSSDVLAYRVILTLDQSEPISHCGYELEAVFISDNEVKFMLDDEISDTLGKKEYFKFKEGSAIFVSEILEEEAQEGPDKVLLKFYPATCRSYDSSKIDESGNDLRVVEPVQISDNNIQEEIVEKPAVEQKPQQISSPFDPETMNIIVEELKKDQLVIQPLEIDMRSEEEFVIAVGYTNKYPEPAGFMIKAYPSDEDSDFRLAYSPYSKILEKGNKHLTPVYIMSTEDSAKGDHSFIVELYKDDNVIEQKEFIVTLKRSWFSEIFEWIKLLFV